MEELLMGLCECIGEFMIEFALSLAWEIGRYIKEQTLGSADWEPTYKGFVILKLN